MNRLIFAIVICTFFLSSCYVVTAYRFRKFELKDVDHFRSSVIKKSSTPFHFFYSDKDNSYLANYLDSNLTNTETYAFLVIKNDSIIYEKYFGDLGPGDIFPSFSVAKSFVGSLVQIAKQEGKIKSLDEPVTNYLPWLLKSDKRWRNVTIQHVLDMRSGVYSNEKYNSPFSDVIRLGFTRNMDARLRKLKIDTPPGNFIYQSVNTQILASVVQAATNRKLENYLNEKLWQPMQMESDAYWQTDVKGTVRAFCCLNATAKDFAKLGRLYLNHGNWNGNQVLSKEWVQTILSEDTMLAYQGYKNHWWSSRKIKRFKDSAEQMTFVNAQKENWYTAQTTRNGKIVYSAYQNLPAVFAQGMLGQYVYIHPKKKLIIVRLGHGWRYPGVYAQKFIENVSEMIP